MGKDELQSSSLSTPQSHRPSFPKHIPPPPTHRERHNQLFILSTKERARGRGCCRQLQSQRLRFLCKLAKRLVEKLPPPSLLLPGSPPGPRVSPTPAGHRDKGPRNQRGRCGSWRRGRDARGKSLSVPGAPRVQWPGEQRNQVRVSVTPTLRAAGDSDERRLHSSPEPNFLQQTSQRALAGAREAQACGERRPPGRTARTHLRAALGSQAQRRPPRTARPAAARGARAAHGPRGARLAGAHGEG